MQLQQWTLWLVVLCVLGSVQLSFSIFGLVKHSLMESQLLIYQKCIGGSNVFHRLKGEYKMKESECTADTRDNVQFHENRGKPSGGSDLGFGLNPPAELKKKDGNPFVPQVNVKDLGINLRAKPKRPGEQFGGPIVGGRVTSEYTAAAPLPYGNVFHGGILPLAHLNLTPLRKKRERKVESESKAHESVRKRTIESFANVKCVLQRLSYLDTNMNINFTSIEDKIKNLPIGSDVKRRLVVSSQICKDFSRCSPVDRLGMNDAILTNILRLVIYTNCYAYLSFQQCLWQFRQADGPTSSEPEDDQYADFFRGDNSELLFQTLQGLLYVKNDGIGSIWN